METQSENNNIINSIKKIGILTFWEFPEGMAPTTRILAYSKGLTENNVEVEIYSFRRIFNSDRKKKGILKSGKVGKTAYTYLHFFNDLGKKIKFFRVIDEIILRMKLFFKVFRSNKKLKFDCFLFSFDDNVSLSTYTKIFKFFNFPIFFVADEYPIPIRDFMKDSIPAIMISEYKKNHKYFAGRVVMTESLKSFYNETISDKPTFILNTIIDNERFLNITPLKPNKEYICYMGNMGLTKDNVDHIVKAFKRIEKVYPDLELHLYGNPSENNKQIILNLINSLNLDKKVLFLGRANYGQVPKILCGAKILVNSQPITRRAQGGFPTKLGEYLLTGKPSVFTDSGDISKVIKDGVHAFIVPPENEEAYAGKLIEILSNYENALNIAANGKALIMNEFNAKAMTAEMLKFISNCKLEKTN